MAIVYFVDWDAEQLITKISKEPEPKLDLGDALWEAFGDSNRKIEFTTEFLEFIASKLDVESVKAFELKCHGSQNSHSFLEDCNGKKYVLRMGGEGFSTKAEQKGDRTAKEYKDLKILQEVLPEIVAFRVYFYDDSMKFTNYAYFVGEFINGKSIGLDVTTTDDMAIEMAKLTKKLHSFDVTALKERGFSTSSVFYAPNHEIFSDMCENIHDVLPGDLAQRIFDATRDVLPLVLKSPVGLTHGDLHVANMMQTDSGYRMVDWEACHVGYMVIDVATFILRGAYGFSEEQREIFLNTYGYGQTEEERLVLWFFELKRHTFLVWLLTADENLSKMEQAEILAQVGVGEIEKLLKERATSGEH